MAYQHIKGAEELQRRLLELPAKIERNVLRGALRAGAKVFEQVAQQEVPRRTGKLARSIRVSTKTRRGLVMAKAKIGNSEAHYAHMVHGGAKAHDIPGPTTKAGRNALSRVLGGAPVPSGRTRSGRVALRAALFFGGRFVRRVRHPGIKANPFMKRAFERGAGQAIAAIADYLRKRLDKLDRPSE